MEMTVTDLGSAAKLALSGRLDAAGVDRIETRFTAAVVPSGRHALVDLSEVSFCASMGIRMLLATARALRGRNARMVLFGAQPLVKESLQHAGIDSLIPLADSESAAAALLQA
jgi:anti-anti-sigma factor